MAGDTHDETPRLDQIGTDWHTLGDPARFALRYMAAIRAYLGALLPDPAAADEVAQQFMLRVVERGFRTADPRGGRFRHYLKAALRNAARTHRRREAARPPTAPLPAEDGVGGPAPDRVWLDEWRRCLLDRAFDALAGHERTAAGNLACTVLRLHLDYPGETSAGLAKRVAARTGVTLRPDAVRKQFSRARRLFAAFLVREVAATVEPASREQVEAELAELGFLHHVRNYLPPDEG